MNQLLEEMSKSFAISRPGCSSPGLFLESACKWSSYKLDYSENLDI